MNSNAVHGKKLSEDYGSSTKATSKGGVWTRGSGVPSSIEHYHKFELPSKKSEAKEAQKFRSITSEKAQKQMN